MGLARDALTKDRDGVQLWLANRPAMAEPIYRDEPEYSRWQSERGSV